MSADLAAEIRAVLRRYARTMADGDGDPPRGLVGELVRIAERHARELAEIAARYAGGSDPLPPSHVTTAMQIAGPQDADPGLDKVIGLDQLPGSARAMPPAPRTPRPKPARRRPAADRPSEPEVSE